MTYAHWCNTIKNVMGATNYFLIISKDLLNEKKPIPAFGTIKGAKNL